MLPSDALSESMTGRTLTFQHSSPAKLQCFAVSMSFVSPTLKWAVGSAFLEGRYPAPTTVVRGYSTLAESLVSPSRVSEKSVCMPPRVSALTGSSPSATLSVVPARIGFTMNWTV